MQLAFFLSPNVIGQRFLHLGRLARVRLSPPHYVDRIRPFESWLQRTYGDAQQSCIVASDDLVGAPLVVLLYDVPIQHQHPLAALRYACCEGPEVQPTAPQPPLPLTG